MANYERERDLILIGAYEQGSDPKVDYALVHNLSKLCRDLDILTVAEFVENQNIWDALKDMGINYAQGYHIGMPLPEMQRTIR